MYSEENQPNNDQQLASPAANIVEDSLNEIGVPIVTAEMVPTPSDSILIRREEDLRNRENALNRREEDLQFREVHKDQLVPIEDPSNRPAEVAESFWTKPRVLMIVIVGALVICGVLTVNLCVLGESCTKGAENEQAEQIVAVETSSTPSLSLARTKIPTTSALSTPSSFPSWRPSLFPSLRPSLQTSYESACGNCLVQIASFASENDCLNNTLGPEHIVVKLASGFCNNADQLLNGPNNNLMPGLSIASCSDDGKHLRFERAMCQESCEDSACPIASDESGVPLSLLYTLQDIPIDGACITRRIGSQSITLSAFGRCDPQQECGNYLRCSSLLLHQSLQEGRENRNWTRFKGGISGGFKFNKLTPLATPQAPGPPLPSPLPPLSSPLPSKGSK